MRRIGRIGLMRRIGPMGHSTFSDRRSPLHVQGRLARAWKILRKSVQSSDYSLRLLSLYLGGKFKEHLLPVTRYTRITGKGLFLISNEPLPNRLVATSTILFLACSEISTHGQTADSGLVLSSAGSTIHVHSRAPAPPLKQAIQTWITKAATAVTILSEISVRSSTSR